LFRHLFERDYHKANATGEIYVSNSTKKSLAQKKRIRMFRAPLKSLDVEGETWENFYTFGCLRCRFFNSFRERENMQGVKTLLKFVIILLKYILDT
jgi:hypothetical protein